MSLQGESKINSLSVSRTANNICSHIQCVISACLLTVYPCSPLAFAVVSEQKMNCDRHASLAQLPFVRRLKYFWGGRVL